MAYNSKIKKYTKMEDGTYFVQNYSTGTYFFIQFFNLLFSIIFFPLILIKNIIFGKKKKNINKRSK